jgi:hypothetical protein
MLRVSCRKTTDVSMKELFTHLSSRSSTSSFCIRSMHASPPGSLHVKLSPEQLEHTQIGSISLKLMHNELTLSILIFPNTKWKISGGLGKLQLDVENMSTDMFKTFLCQTLVVPCVSDLFEVSLQSVSVEMASFMVNANIRTPFRMNFDTYLDFVDELNDSVDTIFPSENGPSSSTTTTKRKRESQEACVVLPKMLKSEKGCAGRVCAVKIKWPKQGTLMVDHSCNAQAFAYQDIELLDRHTQQLHHALEQRSTRVEPK